jgi:nitrate/nitrite-specific signal transduction histidine kinase
MTIMEERARTLSGRIAVAPRAEGGTRVTLIFRPRRSRRNEPAGRDDKFLRRAQA